MWNSNILNHTVFFIRITRSLNIPLTYVSFRISEIFFLKSTKIFKLQRLFILELNLMSYVINKSINLKDYWHQTALNNGQRISVILSLFLLMYTSIEFIPRNKNKQNIKICYLWISSLGVEFHSFPAWNRKWRVTSICVQGWILKANYWILMKAKRMYWG